MNVFVDARLLTSGQDADGQTIVEVSHEALLRRWLPLHQAIEADRASLRLRSELERLAADWNQGRRDESYLLRGARLATVDQWAGEHTGELGPLEHQFLQASRALATRELETARQSKRRLRRLLAGVAALLMIAVVGIGLAVLQNQKARAQTTLARIQANLALSRQLGIQANDLVETCPVTAALVGLESLSLAPGHNQQLSASLVTKLNQLSKNPASAGSTETVRRAVLSPDRRTLVIFGKGHALQLWDVASGHLLGELSQFDSETGAGAFSPDGRFLTIASYTDVRTWSLDDRAQPRLVALLTGHTDFVTAVAFNPDGRMLASVSADGTVLLWETATGRSRNQPLHAVSSYEIGFSPDGRLLVANSDRRTWAWNPITREQQETEQTDPALGLVARKASWFTRRIHV